MNIVSNATPLIASARLDRLIPLRDLLQTVHIPQAVYEEVAVRGPDRPGAAQIRQTEWLHLHEPENRTKINYLQADLDSGEAEVLVLAEELGAHWVLLDESRARHAGSADRVS